MYVYYACVYHNVVQFKYCIARNDVMEAGDHLRQAVLGCFDSIFTSAASSAARTKAEQELKALEATDGRR